ncbi:MAG: (d)CMP kinase [Candidatus Njordarchaeota archaeon]
MKKVKKVVILISGPHGTGKSTVARVIAEEFGLRYISAGEIFRKKAREYGMNIVEFTKYVEKNPEIDYEIDNAMMEEIKKGDVVLDSQLAYFFAKKIKAEELVTVSILLYASFEERARRLAEREDISLENAKAEIKAREESEKDRFERLYGAKLWSIEDFDIVINTTQLKKDESIEICVKIVETFIKIKCGLIS